MSQVRHVRGVVGTLGDLYLFPYAPGAGAASVGVRVTADGVSLVDAERSVITDTTSALAVVPGDVVDVTHDAGLRRVEVSVNGREVIYYSYPAVDVTGYPYAALGTLGAAWSSVTVDDGSVPPPPPPPPPPPVVGRPVEGTIVMGPDGTRFCPRTPWFTDDVGSVLEIDPYWPKIVETVKALSAPQVGAGVKVLLRPGDLTGLGGAESSPAVLSNLGSRDWSRNVLIAPRDGWGSVRIVGQAARFLKVHGLTFAQLDGLGITRTGCINNSLAWCRLQSHRTTGLNGQETYASNLYEVVKPDARVSDVDPAGFASGYPGSPAVHAGKNAWLHGCEAVGCYSAPNWVPVGGIGHNDSWQLYGAGVYWGFDFRHTALWGSNNCALQAGGWSSGFDAVLAAERVEMDYFFRLNHCLLVGPQSNAAMRYPVLEGAKPPTLNQAVNGSGRSGYLVAEGGTILIGSVYPSTWKRVHDTRISTPATRAPVLDGGFTLDPSLGSLSAADLEALSPTPTQEYLDSIWGIRPTA